MTSRLHIVIRIIIILAMGYSSAHIIFNTDFWLAGMWLFGFTGLAIVNLVLYLERSKRDLYNFLDAVKQHDFTQAAGLQGYAPENKELRKVYKQLQRVFRTLHSEKESHHLFLQTIIKHIDTAIIAYDESGIIKEANEAVNEMFGVPYFKSLDRLLKYEPELYNQVFNLQNERFTYKMEVRGLTQVLSIKTTKLSIKGTGYRLVSFQDIRNELEEKELDSWQKLIRILTHEIMNSTIPISTLASVIAQMIVDEENEVKTNLSEEEKRDIYGGLKTIESRSKGLSEFVDSYRTLTKVKPPKLASHVLSDLVDENILLLQNKLNENGVQIKRNFSDAEVNLDRELISQVIINILLNAIDAIREVPNPEINLSIVLRNNKVELVICDNGCGIDGDTLDNIFIPFFSTKKEGSGIGLSLARQIMRLHNAKISVKSQVAVKTCFTLEF